MAGSLVKLAVLENATQKNVTGEKNWAAVKKTSGYVVVQATTGPKNDAAEWKQLAWSGDAGEAVPNMPNRRRLPLNASRRYHVEASLGGAKDAIDVWILWASIEILVKGNRPAGAARFDPGSRDGTDRLGPVTYESIASSVIDEKAGVFVANTGASGKVAPVATLSPKGVRDVVKSGWTFRREVWSRNWADGRKLDTTNSSWTNDTSKPAYLQLTPDSEDKIYDLDAPDIRWGEKSYETYNNFRQWIEWAGEKCSDHALWYWQARWSLDRDPRKQVVLNDLGAGKNIVLPEKPFFAAPAKSR